MSKLLKYNHFLEDEAFHFLTVVAIHILLKNIPFVINIIFTFPRVILLKLAILHKTR